MFRSTIVLMAVALGGCASTTKINQFRSFAEVGRQEQAAVSGIVDQAISSNIDANSREILDARDQLVAVGKWGPIDPDNQLDRNNKAVIETTRQLTAIKRHAALLDEYFRSIAALADYDSSAIAASTRSTVGALTKLSPQLAALKVGDVTLPAAAGSLAPVIVDHIKAHVLALELREHADTIGKELELQARILTFLSMLIARDQDLLAQHQILDQLATPYADLQKPLPGEWMETRRAILLGQAGASEPAAKAAELAAKMRLTFVSLCEGEASADDLAGYASDLSSLLTLVQVVSASPARDDK